MKQQFLKGKTDIIRLTVYSNNRPVVPTSGTVELYKPDGSVLQADTAVTIDATTGEMTYNLTATHTANHDLNYKAVWSYVVSSVTYFETQLFDVVKCVLSIPIVDEDLFNELESLRRAFKQETGTATAGAAGTITDTIRRKEPNNFWKGGFIEILAGTGVGQMRDITSNAQSTGVISVSPDWTTNPDTTSVYRVVKSFTKKIEQSFSKLETMLYNKGKRHSLILESSQIEFPLLYLTIHLICLDLMDEEGDKWDRLAKLYYEKFEKSFNTMKLEYDEDESGTIMGEDEEQTSPASLRIGRA